MDRDRLGTNTIRHNAQRAAILLAHPCGFGICLELSAFPASFVRSRSSLIAENFLLRKQLAFYQEHQVRPRRLIDTAR